MKHIILVNAKTDKSFLMLEQGPNSFILEIPNMQAAKMIIKFQANALSPVWSEIDKEYLKRWLF